MISWSQWRHYSYRHGRA